MAGNDYLSNYQNLRLNEVVIPGSHDAGVYTANKSNVQTQALDIAGQANAGCRFFDLRIATYRSTVGGQTTYTNKAFHLDQSLVVDHKVKNTPGVTSYQNVGHAGGWGGGLDDMLDDARTFVTTNPTEFLILKFSKCANWASIANACITRLGPAHYTDAGNLNNKTVRQLSGRVITVFDESARPKLIPVITAQGGRPHGILFIKALYDSDSGTSKTYDPNFWGIQYFGKFSSTDKVSKNTAKQGRTLVNGAATHMDVLGMMYWTTTGLFGDIRQRNNTMWNQTNVAALQQTWKSGLEASITQRFGNEKDSAMLLAQTHGGALGGRLKSFMPNIVMMDFVDQQKCDIVEQLNAVAATSLLQLMIPAPRGPQPHPDPIG
ncbi:hypothetical protein B0E46_07920 [Rhodanobacter sp. B04]|uniref:hypothetical protein n=1 Tax=Rhodanobacter sp. B04 TaxID=1945860 RepID=UPI00098789B9|nr:hypothetical protein [Rhodanobacter sp. B04]OOG63864.1 hypothetical protein B0E46_07920 [Rhodanobacter sp. B04]